MAGDPALTRVVIATFGEADVQWLEICKSPRAVGMPVAEIAEHGRLLA